MNSRGNWRYWVAALVFGTCCGGRLQAQLPGLNAKEWLGYFAGYQNSHFKFGITRDGKCLLQVIGAKGVTINRKLAVDIDFLVEEVAADGSAKTLAIVPSSLKSEQPATERPRKVVIQGKVKGDFGFEINVDEDRGVILLGGRLLETGAPATKPLRFSIRLKFPDAYPSDPNQPDKKQLKAFEEKAKDDRVQLLWTDGKRAKPPVMESVDAGSKEINGPGIASAQIEFSTYQGQRIELTALDNSALRFSNTKQGPLHAGFLVTWSINPTKDSEHKSRLKIDVR